MWALALAAALALGQTVPVAAADMSEAPATVEVRENPVAERWGGGLQFNSPFSPCAMNCAVHGFAGRYVRTPMSDIFGLSDVTAPWDWKFRDSTIVGAAFSRDVLTYGRFWAFETEIGAAKRFGAQDEWELWGALYWRWKAFPWNDYVRTSIAVSTGVNWASDVSRIEREKSPRHQSQVLHYLSPEITFGPPGNPNLDVVLRFHHRSGGDLALFDKTGGGSQYQTIGLRYRW